MVVMINQIRNRRINQPRYKRELQKFYKTIMNSRQAGRGRDMVIISVRTFYRIVEVIRKLQYSADHKNRHPDVASYLEFICLGNRYSESTFPIKRHVLSVYLKRAIVQMKINVSPKQITLNSLYTSGQMIRTAQLVGFDLEYECQIYGIPYI